MHKFQTLASRVWHAGKREKSVWLTTLRTPSLFFVLLSLLGVFLLVGYLPLSYHIDVGVEEGYGGDLPLLWNVNTPEKDEHGTFRWTRDNTVIRLPGLGSRPIVVHLSVFPISPYVIEVGPRSMEIRAAGEPLALLPISQTGRVYRLLLPTPLMSTGTGEFSLHSTTFTPPGDPRQLGTPLDSIHIQSLTAPYIILPDWHAVWQWLLALLVFQVMIMRCLEHHSIRYATWFTGVSALLIALAAYLDPPRWGYGATPVLVAMLWSYGAVLMLQPLLPLLAERLRFPLQEEIAGWLLMIVAVALGMRLGGRLFPLSMWGDIGFHTNRFVEALGLGEIYLVSRNRGIDFPYPPGTYLTLAPLVLLQLNIRFILPFVAAVLDGLSAIPIYIILVKAMNPSPISRPRYQVTALIAASFYVFTAAGMMLTWWSFDTHIYTQTASVILIAALMVLGIGYEDDHFPTSAWILGVLISGVFLGHFGFLINTVLMGGLVVVLVWLCAWRGNGWARQRGWPLLLSYGGAGIFALASFYTAYLWLFEYQMQVVSQKGMPELAARAPVSRLQMWHNLLHVGLIKHFGFFPLVLMPIGLWRILAGVAQKGWTQQRGRLVLFALMGCSIMVSSLFAVIPFITLATNSTRWMMFSAWVVAIGGAIAFQMVWHCGRAGRLVVIGMTGYVVWNTAFYWLAPMLWRIRPPEPF